MNYEIQEALGQIAREKNVRPEQVMETLQAGLILAAKKKYGPNANVEVAFDPKRGLSMSLKKTVVETVTDPQVEISLSDAERYTANPALDDEVVISLPTEQ